MFRKRNQTSKDIDSNSKIICLIERKTIKVSRVEVNPEKQLLISDIQTFDWDKLDLANVFRQIAKTYACQNLDIILGEDLASVVTLMVPQGVNDPQIAASEKAELLFGEAFESLGIDYAKTYSDARQIWMQLFVVKRSFLNLLGKSLQTAQLTLDSIEPLSISLARLTYDKDQPHVILWGESYLHATLIYKNQVVASQLVRGDNIYKQIESLLSSLEQRYSLTLDHIIMATKKIDSKKLSPKIADVTETELNPFAGSVADNQEFALDSVLVEEKPKSSHHEKEMIINDDASLENEEDEVLLETDEEEQMHSDKKLDSDIMSAESVSAPKPPLKLVNQKNNSDMTNINEPPAKSNAKLIAVIVTVVVVLVGMLVGGYFVYQNALSEANQPPIVAETPVPEIPSTEEPVETASPSAEPTEEIDVATVKVEVLNGSGTPGAAGTLSNELTDAGFEDIDAGNADSYDYETTEVRVKAGNDELYQLVVEALEDEYEVTEGDPLEEDSEYDVQVIVGQS